jgi:hypothetical protein
LAGYAELVLVREGKGKYKENQKLMAISSDSL